MAVEERYIQAIGIQKNRNLMNQVYRNLVRELHFLVLMLKRELVYEAASLMNSRNQSDFHHEMNDPVKICGSEMSVMSAEGCESVQFTNLMKS